MTGESDRAATPASWRDDPGWRLVQYAPDLWSESDAPDKPTPEAELANPPVWASLYDGSRIVATWRRLIVPERERSSR